MFQHTEMTKVAIQTFCLSSDGHLEQTFGVFVSPADGKSQSKPMMEHSKNDECVVCTVGVNTHHYAGSLCSASVPQ